MKKTVFIVVYFFASNFIYGQITFQRMIGGAQEDYAQRIRPTNDGGYIIVGRSGSIGGGAENIYLAKLDSAWNLIWDKTYGTNGSDYGYDVHQTNDGGYIVSGIVGGGGFIIRTDSVGNLIWQRYITFGLFTRLYAVGLTNDGGFIAGGNFNTTSLGLLKLDSSGNVIWVKLFNPPFGGGYIFGVQQTSDGGYAAIGSINNDFLILKTDSGGNVAWAKAYGTLSYLQIGYSLRQTSDGGFIVAGFDETPSSTINAHMSLLKTDASGNVQWMEELSPNTTQNIYTDRFTWTNTAQQTADGGYIVCGSVIMAVGNANVFLIKTDSAGSIVWSKNYGSTSFDYAYWVEETSDGGYIIAGETQSFSSGFSNIYLIKTDSLGNSGCYEANGGYSVLWSGVITPLNITLSPVTGIPSVSGITNISGNGNGVTIICPLITDVNEPAITEKGLELFPNPATSKLTVQSSEFGEIESIEIYSSLGESVFQSQISSLKSQISIDVSQLSPGIYFITVTDQAGNKATRKVVKM